MSRIDLMITGICSFAPKYPLEKWKKGQDNEMTVLLVESAKPLPGHSSHGHEAHELHVPVLLCPEKYVVRKGFRSPDAMFYPTPYPNQAGEEPDQLMAIFYLDDQEVFIKPLENNKWDIDLAPATRCPTNESNLTSFYWMAQLAKVNEGSEQIRDACFDPVCDPSVISRLHLLQGNITTAKLATDLEKRILIWIFDEVHPKTKRKPEKKDGQAIAAVAGVHFELGEEKGIEFTTSLLKTKTGYRESSNRRVSAVFEKAPQKSLQIRLEPCDDGFPRAWIKNMPWLDILQIRLLEERVCDVHFAHVYKISEGSDHVPQKVPCATDGICFTQVFDRRHGAGVDCPGATGRRRDPGE